MKDEELLILEQLTYIDEDVLNKAGLKYDALDFKGVDSVEKLLSDFDEKALFKLRSADWENGNGADASIGGALMSGNEIADIIEAAQNNPNISKLKIVDSYSTTTRTGKKVTLGICYKDPNTKKSDAIVTFKGTSGHDEWNDNVEGINTSDTKAQLDAKQFIERIPRKYKDITVVGHSKGANKAMYVTIADKSSRIKRCVAFDGQGFSYKFMQKYKKQINEKAKYIKNYSLEEDFVHVLMLQIPESNQIYCKGYGVANFAQNHSPNSFFKTKNGRMITDEHGCPKFTITNKESSKISWIRDFVKYVMDHSSEKELVKIIGCLGPFLGYMLGDGEKSEAIKYLWSDKSDFKLVIKKYEEYKKYSGVDTVLIKEESYIEGYKEIKRNYSDDFYDYLIEIYKKIKDIPFYDVNNNVRNFYGQTFLSHIEPWNAVSGIQKEYNAAAEYDEEQCELIKQVFEKAKELDYEYSKTVKKRSDAVKELTDIFFTDFGID
ncbi:MAG: DUF2974 domain-containing protein [Lachnospiraceae bacterium]|nr:DUF2974 domain-containing protein [Lachnospiraceae bacterium]